MDRYADVNKLIWQVQNNDKYGTITKQVFISLLQNSETEDVALVIHAHWKLNANKNHDICANCGTFAPMLFDDDGERIEWLSDYCPNCGAKMDEEVAE